MLSSFKKMTNRIPSLDGLRAIAVSMVIACHAYQRNGAARSPRLYTYSVIVSVTGVKIFFVLSGFLITSLLLKELNRTGTIDIRSFYWRRTLRIFPALYAFLIAVWAGYALGIVDIHQDSPLKILSPAAFLSDYIQVLGWPLHHTWSLSVEEQFYMLWPAALVFCGLRRAGLFPALLIVVALLSRALSFDEYRFDSVGDSIAVGCLISIYRAPLERALLRLWPRSLPMAALMFLPLAVLPVAIPESRLHMFAMFVGIPLLNASIGIAMLGVMVRPPAWLNASPVVGVGRLSYSLYLWQNPWVADLRSGWMWFPAAILCGWLSYAFIEQPVLRWRDRVATVSRP